MTTRPLQRVFYNPAIRTPWYMTRRGLTWAMNAMQPPAVSRSISLCKGPSESQPREFPKLIWSFWSGEQSPTVRACGLSIEQHAEGFDLVQVSLERVTHFLPDFPPVPPSTPIQKISNLVRLMLLERYGGIWLDASILVTQDLDWIPTAFSKSNFGMIGIYNEFPDEYASNPLRPIIENGFIAARPGDPFVRRWLSTYADCILSTDYQNYFQVARSNFSELTSNFLRRDQSDLAYFVCYIAAQEALLETTAYSLQLINAEDDYYFYYYNTSPPRSRRQFAEEILLKRAAERTPSLIKITGGHRSVMDDYIRNRCYRKHSIAGRYL